MEAVCIGVLSEEYIEAGKREHDQAIPKYKKHLTLSSDCDKIPLGYSVEYFIRDYLKALKPGTLKYDFILNDKNIDVKTMIVTYPPKEEHFSGVLAKQPSQDIDIYLFAQYDKSSNTVWLKGWKKYKELIHPNNLYTAGSRSDKIVLKHDHYQVKNYELNKLSEL